MKFTELHKHLLVAVMLAILVLMWGCGSGGESTPNAVVGKSTAVTIIPSGNGTFTFQGNDLKGVAGIDLTVTYDSSFLTTPTISQGSFITGTAMFVTNPIYSSNAFKIAILTAIPFSGGGHIASVSFASHTGTGSITVTGSVLDSKGAPLGEMIILTANDFQSP
mgnify:CR=1 FL=1